MKDEKCWICGDDATRKSYYNETEDAKPVCSKECGRFTVLEGKMEEIAYSLMLLRDKINER